MTRNKDDEKELYDMLGTKDDRKEYDRQFKNIKSNRYYWFAWLNYLMGTVMFLIFYEKGFRMMHANFSWGYMHGMFFVFLMTLIVMVRNIREWWKSWKVIFVVGEIAVFCYHLVCGVNFLMYAVLGNDLAGF